MRFGAIVRVGVRILRSHWAVLLGLALLFVGPGALLTAATGMRFTDVAIDVFPGIEEGMLDTGILVTEAELERLLGALGTYLVATVVAGLLASLGAVGFSAVVGADYHHRPITFGEALGVALRRALSALTFIVITTIITIGIAVGGLLLIVAASGLLGAGSLDQGGPGVFVSLIIVVIVVVTIVYLTMRWAPALPVMANEGAGWRQAMTRSWHLSGANVWRIFGVVVFAVLTTAVLAAFAGQLLGLLLVDVIGAALGLDPVIAESIALALATVLLASLAPVLTAVLYFDLRVRRDPADGEATPRA
jgi:hypothetical protein